MPWDHIEALAMHSPGGESCRQHGLCGQDGRMARVGRADRAPEQQLTKVSCVVLFCYYFRQHLCFVTRFLFCDTPLSAVIQQSQILHLFIKANSPSPLFLHTFYCKNEKANTEQQ